MSLQLNQKDLQENTRLLCDGASSIYTNFTNFNQMPPLIFSNDKLLWY